MKKYYKYGKIAKKDTNLIKRERKLYQIWWLKMENRKGTGVS